MNVLLEEQLPALDARDVVHLALERLRTDPFVFLCAPSAGCEECDRARSGRT